jgi:hypothetical protein
VEGENLATIGFANLSEILFNQVASEAQASQPSTQSNASTNTLSPAIGDEFTPSAQNEEPSAGLFTANPFSQFSTASAAVLAPVVSAALATTSAVVANANTAPVSTTNNEAQLQTLNAALEGLGLSDANIRKIDGIAVLINNFHLTSFTFLAYQLKAQQLRAPTVATTVPPAQSRTATA